MHGVIYLSFTLNGISKYNYCSLENNFNLPQIMIQYGRMQRNGDISRKMLHFEILSSFIH